LLPSFPLLPLLPAGRTAQLVAKYRPPMPILTLVVPRLVNDGIRWRLEGK
jgi:pyruvate kinase